MSIASNNLVFEDCNGGSDNAVENVIEDNVLEDIIYENGVGNKAVFGLQSYLQDATRKFKDLAFINTLNTLIDEIKFYLGDNSEPYCVKCFELCQEIKYNYDCKECYYCKDCHHSKDCSFYTPLEFDFLQPEAFEVADI